MDDNKRLKLIEIGYVIHGTCGNCKHSTWSDPGTGFGECLRNQYVHLKHSGGQRNLSINVAGSCPEHEWDQSERAYLHRFEEFIK